MNPLNIPDVMIVFVLNIAGKKHSIYDLGILNEKPRYVAKENFIDFHITN